MSSSNENRSLWWEILKSTALIHKANSGHFHVLSILFLFPLFFCLVVYPYFHLALFHPDYNFTIFTQSFHFTISSFEIVVLILCTLVMVVLFICAVATITYSTVQASYGSSINLVSSIKFIRNSFFPLLSTFIVSHAIFISITLVFALVLVFLLQILQTFGLVELKYDLNHFLFLVAFALIVLVPILMWLQVNWSLAYVVAVVESTYGFETLRRSAHLVKGLRSIAFWRHLFYGLTMGGLVGGASMFLVSLGTSKKVEQWWNLLAIILPILESCVMGYMMMMNQYLRGNSVLYMYSKDLNDEKLFFEIGDELETILVTSMD